MSPIYEPTIIDTTVSLQPEHIRQLNSAAENTELSRSDLIVHLWKAMMRFNERDLRLKGTISYQEKGDYEIVHVRMDEITYEQKLDLRRFYKMSASKVLALAIDLFLEDLVFKILTKKKEESIVIGQFYQKYHISVDFGQNFTEYTIRWGPQAQ